MKKEKIPEKNCNVQYLIKGKLYNPILFGSEGGVWNEGITKDSLCPDCACKVGQKHLTNCDIERCPACGGQMFSCSCGLVYEIDEASIPLLGYLKQQQEITNKKMLEDLKKMKKKHQDEME